MLRTRRGKALVWLTAAWLLVSVLLVARAYRQEVAATAGARTVAVETALLGPAVPGPLGSPGAIAARRGAAVARAGLFLSIPLYALAALLVLGRGRLQSVSLGLLLLVLCMLALEAATQVVGIHVPALPRATAADHGISVYDRTKGWFHVPGARGAVPIPGGGPGRVRINSLGLRGPEVTLRKPEGVVRVLVLGDSFAFGMGVEERHLFTTLLEGLLEDGSPGREFQVINLGVLGYATDQELILFQELGTRLMPDAVVLLMCDNDFLGNVQDFVYRRYYKPFFELEAGGRLRAFNQPVPHLDRGQRARLFLGQESNLWNALRRWTRSPDLLEVAVPRDTDQDPILLTAALVRGLSGIVEAAGARLLVANTAHRGEETPLFHALRPRLEGIAQLGLEGFLSRARRNQPDRLWDFPGDTHWNRDTHQLVAQVLAGHLVRHGLVPPPASR